MIEGSKNIKRLVSTFEHRGVRLFHACQLKDFESYVRLGGVPSRNLMEENNEPFTEFETDDQDRRNWVWDKVFVNLQDFGWTFQHSLEDHTANSVPNPYGPILLILHPKALTVAEDVAISLRSAGGIGFDRLAQSLGLADIDRLFFRPTGNLIKFRRSLSEEFGIDEEYISAPEASCTIREEKLPLAYLDLVRVDPYVFEGTPLVDRVKRVVRDGGIRVFERDGGSLYQDLFTALSRRIHPTLTELAEDPEASPELRGWAKSLSQHGQRLTRQWPRYANYLQDGTINWLGRP